MKPRLSSDDSRQVGRPGVPPWPWLAALVGVAVWLAWPRGHTPHVPEASDAAASVSPAPPRAMARTPRTLVQVPGGAAATAEEIVAGRLDAFVRGRRELVQALARHLGSAVPAEIEEFFALAEAGRWDEAEALYVRLSDQRKAGVLPPELNRLFPALLETIGVHEAVRDWPAQALLDYGQAVLDALPPDAVYLGGTDPGRFIPTLLNDTSDGERHVVLTQNALADRTYADYAGFLHGDRLASLTAEDSQRAFQDYLADAAKRLAHDREFPGEPRQVRPGEDIQDTGDGRVQVSGQLAVMAINERLVKTLMDRNPGAPFALEESFPFTALYAEAVPRGPLLELQAGDGQASLTPERVMQSTDYWRETTQRLLADPETSGSPEARAAYAKLALAQAGLLKQHQFSGEAEQLFRSAQELAPGNPEAVMRYVGLLTEQQRFADAIPVAEAALRESPDSEPFRQLLQELRSHGPP